MLFQKMKRVSFIGKQEDYTALKIVNEDFIYNPEDPLLSIHLGSNRPRKITEFVEALEAVTFNKNAYEVNVKIDSEDQEMIQCVRGLIDKYGEKKIKPLIAPRKNGLWSLWEYYNVLLKQANPSAYFYWNPSDEVHIATEGWDQILANYIGFFPDHIFRLKLSDNRLRNYYQLSEVTGTPDNFPFMTKKWMEICSTWGDCHSPDLFHQGVSYLLGKMDVFRDIPIFDIDLANIEAGGLLTAKQKEDRTIGCKRVWGIAMSKPMRMRYYAHARKLYHCINAFKEPNVEIEIKDYVSSGLLICESKFKKTIYSFKDDEKRLAILEKDTWSVRLNRFLAQCLDASIMYVMRHLPSRNTRHPERSQGSPR